MASGGASIGRHLRSSAPGKGHDRRFSQDELWKMCLVGHGADGMVARYLRDRKVAERLLAELLRDRRASGYVAHTDIQEGAVVGWSLTVRVRDGEGSIRGTHSGFWQEVHGVLSRLVQRSDIVDGYIEPPRSRRR